MIDLTDSKPILLNCIIICLILLTSVLSNIFNLIIFLNKNIRKVCSSYRYLCWLSLIDLCTLLVSGIDVLLKFGFYKEVRLYSLIICRLHTFLSNFLFQAGSCLLIIINIERAIAFSKKQSINQDECEDQFHSLGFKVKRKIIGFFKSEKLIIASCLILVIINSHYLMFMNINSLAEVNGQNQTIALIQNRTRSLFIKFKTEWPELIRKLSVKDQMSSRLLNIFNPNRYNSYAAKNDSNFQIYPIYMCFPNNASKYHYFLNNVWIWIHVTIVSIIPFLVGLVSCSIIWYQIQKNKSAPDTMLREHKKFLLTLILINVYAAISFIPLDISLANYKFEELQHEYSFFQAFAQIITFTKGSFNFISFYFFLNNYKQNFIKLFKKE